MTELLKQGLYQPDARHRPGAEHLCRYAGHLDEVPMAEVRPGRRDSRTSCATQKHALWQKITDTKNLDDAAMAATADDRCGEFQKLYAEKEQAGDSEA